MTWDNFKETPFGITICYPLAIIGLIFLVITLPFYFAIKNLIEWIHGR